MKPVAPRGVAARGGARDSARAARDDFRPGLKPRGHEDVLYPSTRKLLRSLPQRQAPRLPLAPVLEEDALLEFVVIDDHDQEGD